MSAVTDPTYRRCEELWTPDGDIVIQSGSDDDSTRVLYRMHRASLGEAPVLTDMVASALRCSHTPESLRNLLDESCLDLPLLTLAYSVDETTVFLQALHDQTSFPPPPGPSLPPESSPLPPITHILAVLRLSTVYDVTRLRRIAIAHLDTFFPTSFPTLSKTLRALSSGLKIDTFPGPARHSTVPVSDLISRAYEARVPWIIPYSTYLYTLSATMSRLTSDIILSSYISAPDRSACLIAFAHKFTHLARMTLHLQRYPLHDVDTHTCAGEADWEVLRAVFVEGADALADCVLHTLRYTDMLWLLIDAAAPGIRACDACVKAVGEESEAARRGYWDELPVVLGLPPWDELEKMREAELGVTEQPM
ncbi:hypothetical protein FISHEDRAFT_69261 [Fistulina hepatica ATCC 64428]|uniref:BTB domain-containing protein n=1 Tax=Fistulina hepatica ATCC 64428 TaxID=1128425 RepID=A0A0D7AQP4_9AGAR|nr:hypothetical protein FISHEDRAFT_69261 [Fistulina hepatica ATCC 64428]